MFRKKLGFFSRWKTFSKYPKSWHLWIYIRNWSIAFIARSALSVRQRRKTDVLLLLLRSENDWFLRRGNGGVDTARRRWRFDTSIFRISKVGRPYKWLRNSICRSRDPFLDHLFAHFLNLRKPPNWRWWRQIKIKVQFDDSLEPILSTSMTNMFSVFTLSDQSIALRAPAVHGVSSYN